MQENGQIHKQRSYDMNPNKGGDGRYENMNIEMEGPSSARDQHINNQNTGFDY